LFQLLKYRYNCDTFRCAEKKTLFTGQAGYTAYKCLPYGSINEALPYLSRRTAENKTVVKKLKKEIELSKKELWSRFKTGQIIYRPKGQYESTV